MSFKVKIKQIVDLYSASSLDTFVISCACWSVSVPLLISARDFAATSFSNLRAFEGCWNALSLSSLTLCTTILLLACSEVVGTFVLCSAGVTLSEMDSGCCCVICRLNVYLSSNILLHLLSQHTYLAWRLYKKCACSRCLNKFLTLLNVQSLQTKQVTIMTIQTSRIFCKITDLGPAFGMTLFSVSSVITRRLSSVISSSKNIYKN